MKAFYKKVVIMNSLYSTPKSLVKISITFLGALGDLAVRKNKLE